MVEINLDEDTVEWRMSHAFVLSLKMRKLSSFCKGCRLGVLAMTIARHVPSIILVGIHNRVATQDEIKKIYGIDMEKSIAIKMERKDFYKEGEKK